MIGGLDVEELTQEERDWVREQVRAERQKKLLARCHAGETIAESNTWDPYESWHGYVVDGARVAERYVTPRGGETKLVDSVVRRADGDLEFAEGCTRVPAAVMSWLLKDSPGNAPD